MARTNSRGTEAWSYSAGKKGKNRVRAFEEKDGQHWLDWHVPLFDKEGNAVIDPKTDKQARKRVRLCITALGVKSRDEAAEHAVKYSKKYPQLIADAEAEAAALRRAVQDGTESDEREEESAGPLTLRKLLDTYIDEVTPTLRPDTQEAHHTHRRLFFAAFGEGAIVERLTRKGRPRTALNRKAYNDFLARRKLGTIPGFSTPARPQTIRNNVRWLRTVFDWAKTEREDGTILLFRNPWDGFRLPPADKPNRPEMTQQLHDRVVAAAPNWRMAEIMRICRAMGRRVNSVRHLALTDIDLQAGTVVWQAAYDKTHTTSVTPLRAAAKQAIRRALERRRMEGVEASRWLFPACRDQENPVSCDTLNNWMRETKAKLGIKIRGLGYHGEKRALIRSSEFKRLRAKAAVEFVGTTYETMQRVYDFVDLPELQGAVTTLDRAATGRRSWRRPVVAVRYRANGHK